MINFKASFVHNTSVKTLNTNGDSCNKEVSLVRLSRKSLSDSKLMMELPNYWCSGNFCSEGMSLDFRYSSGLCRLNSKRQFYVLTKQNDNFETLSKEAVLGIFEITKKFCKKVYIDYFETSPEFTKSNKDREFKHIGSTMMNSIKNLFPDRTLILDCLYSVKNFYTGNGFKEMSRPFNPGSIKMCYRP